MLQYDFVDQLMAMVGVNTFDYRRAQNLRRTATWQKVICSG